MIESKAQTILNQYLREKRKEGFYCYGELKVAKGNSFPFSRIEVNQDEGLPALGHNGLVWKFSDEDSRKKPCDFGSFPPLPAYLVILFGEIFCFIPYEEIAKLKAAGAVSITASQARELSTQLVRTT